MSTKRLSRRSFFRPLRAEQLESRTVMDASGWHNDLLLGDVNVDGVVDATDAATIESFLTLYQSTEVAVTPGTCMSNRIFPDANGDWLVNDDDIDFVGGLYGNTEQAEFEEFGGEGGFSLLSGSGSGSSSGSGGGSSSGSGSGSGPGSGSWVLAGTHSGSEPLRDSSGQAYIEFHIGFSDHNTFTADSIEWGVFETNMAASSSAGNIVGDAELGVDFEAVNPGVLSVSAGVTSHTFVVRVNIFRDDLLEYPEYFQVKLFNPAPTTYYYDTDPAYGIINDSTPAVDLDNDANNDGAISSDDEASEDAGSAALIELNNDDDDGSNYSDSTEAGPISGEDDLEPFEIWVADSGYHDVPNFNGWQLVLSVGSGGRVWESANKSGEIEFNSTQAGLVKTWTIGTDAIPSTLYFEKVAKGSTGLSLELQRPVVGGVGQDSISFTARPSISGFSLHAGEAFEGDGGFFWLVRTNTLDDATIEYQVLGGSAAIDVDLPSTTGTVQFSQGQSLALVTFPYIDDLTEEVNEAFTIVAYPEGHPQLSISDEGGIVDDDWAELSYEVSTPGESAAIAFTQSSVVDPYYVRVIGDVAHEPPTNGTAPASFTIDYSLPAGVTSLDLIWSGSATAGVNYSPLPTSVPVSGSGTLQVVVDVLSDGVSDTLCNLELTVSLPGGVSAIASNVSSALWIFDIIGGGAGTLGTSVLTTDAQNENHQWHSVKNFSLQSHEPSLVQDLEDWGITSIGAASKFEASLKLDSNSKPHFVMKNSYTDVEMTVRTHYPVGPKSVARTEDRIAATLAHEMIHVNAFLQGGQLINLMAFSIEAALQGNANLSESARAALIVKLAPRFNELADRYHKRFVQIQDLRQEFHLDHLNKGVPAVRQPAAPDYDSDSRGVTYLAQLKKEVNAIAFIKRVTLFTGQMGIMNVDDGVSAVNQKLGENDATFIAAVDKIISEINSY